MNLSELISDIASFNNSDASSAKNDCLPSKNYRGNQHELDTYLNTINYLEYKKSIRKNVIQTKVVCHENTFTDTESVQKHFEETQYKKKWSRLDSYLKQKKIEEFVKNKVCENVINSETELKYKTLLIKQLHDKKLNNKKDITYDEINGIISDIPFFNKSISNL